MLSGTLPRWLTPTISHSSREWLDRVDRNVCIWSLVLCFIFFAPRNLYFLNSISDFTAGAFWRCRLWDFCEESTFVAAKATDTDKGEGGDYPNRGPGLWRVGCRPLRKAALLHRDLEQSCRWSCSLLAQVCLGPALPPFLQGRGHLFPCLEADVTATAACDDPYRCCGVWIRGVRGWPLKAWESAGRDAWMRGGGLLHGSVRLGGAGRDNGGRSWLVLWLLLSSAGSSWFGGR